MLSRKDSKYQSSVLKRLDQAQNEQFWLEERVDIHCKCGDGSEKCHDRHEFEKTVTLSL